MWDEAGKARASTTSERPTGSCHPAVEPVHVDNSFIRVARDGTGLYISPMGIVLALIIVGIVLLVFGIAVKAAAFLLWIGIVLLVIGAVMAVMRQVRNKV
ncbi:hypothetical protein [Arthrobacter polaris]|uniref:hypothetical protein n=2 Tax=Arthrobacter polaris TaxID=2813727 RepID=UPI001F3A5623|nr:hypothetical protein [Arthrobacter polaris]UIK90806.1 hypothetical protein J0916_05665 [Arthrobacter polaris]